MEGILVKKTTLSALITIMACTNVYSEGMTPSESKTPLIAAESTVQQNDYSILRERWASYYLGDTSLEFDETLQNEVTKTTDKAKQLLADLTIQEKGLWADVPLNGDKNKLGVQLYTTYKRIFILARAYKSSGGELENDPQLLEKLVESLTFLNEHFYHVGTPERGNWWQWQIGIGNVLNSTLVILYNEMPKALIHNYVEASRYFVPRPTHLSEGYGAPYSSAPLMFKSTGGNRTDNAKIVLIRGILSDNSEEVTTAVESLSSIIPFVTTGDGFYTDGSFIQHKDLPYSGTYGQVMVQGLGLLMGLVADTQFAVTDPNLQKIYPLLLTSFAPLIVDGKVMDMVNGRAVSRTSGQNHIIGQGMLSAMLMYLPGAPEEFKPQLEAFLKFHLSTQENTRIASNYQLAYQIAQGLLNDQTVAAQAPRIMHKQFSQMDRLVHHRESWSFGVSMHSNRVGNYECINGENLKGWYSADGMTYLYNQESNHFAEFWPLVNPYKLPGTTTVQTKREVCTGQLSAQRNGRNRSMDWTGGAQLEQYGVAGMKFANWNSSLSAKKSWFMFDNEVVALGSDIQNNSKDIAVTTIENRKIPNDANVMVNGQKLANESAIEQPLESLSIQYDTQQPAINYYSLGEQPVKVAMQCRQGDWADVGKDSGPVEGCFVEATIDHASGETSSYGYVIVPNDMSDSAAKQAVTVVANTADVHAVEHTGLGIFAANFWDDATAGLVTSTSPMSIMLKTTGDIVKVSVSSPTRSWWDTKFKLEGQYTILADEGKRVVLTDGNKFSIKLSDTDGGSYSFTLQVQASTAEVK